MRFFCATHFFFFLIKRLNSNKLLFYDLIGHFGVPRQMLIKKNDKLYFTNKTLNKLHLIVNF